MSIKFAVKNRVTLPVLKMTLDSPYYVEVTGAIYEGKKIDIPGNDKQKEPAHLMHVIDLESGEEMMIVCNKVMQGTLEEAYPDLGYVGKQFAITKHAKKTGKDYHTFTIVEIEVIKEDKAEVPEKKASAEKPAK